MLASETLGLGFLRLGFLNFPEDNLVTVAVTKVPVGTTLPFALAALGIMALGNNRRLRFFLSNWFGLAVLLYALLTIVGSVLVKENSALLIAALAFGYFLPVGLLCSRAEGGLLQLFHPRHPLHKIALRLVFFGLTLPLIVYGLCVLLILPLIPSYHDVLILVALISTFLLLGAVVAALQSMGGDQSQTPRSGRLWRKYCWRACKARRPTLGAMTSARASCAKPRAARLCTARRRIRRFGIRISPATAISGMTASARSTGSSPARMTAKMKR